MNLHDRILHAVFSFLFEKRDIVINDRLYLRRFYLSGRGTDSQWFLHNIRLPDDGRAMHDHPWDFTSWILLGGYAEETPTWHGGELPKSVVQNRMAGQKLDNTAAHIHRIDNVFGSTWTLVRARKAKRTWGFWVDDSSLQRTWVDWRSYLNLPQDTPDHLEDRF